MSFPQFSDQRTRKTEDMDEQRYREDLYRNDGGYGRGEDRHYQLNRSQHSRDYYNHPSHNRRGNPAQHPYALDNHRGVFGRSRKHPGYQQDSDRNEYLPRKSSIDRDCIYRDESDKDNQRSDRRVFNSPENDNQRSNRHSYNSPNNDAQRSIRHGYSSPKNDTQRSFRHNYRSPDNDTQRSVRHGYNSPNNDTQRSVMHGYNLPNNDNQRSVRHGYNSPNNDTRRSFGHNSISPDNDTRQSFKHYYSPNRRCSDDNHSNFSHRDNYQLQRHSQWRASEAVKYDHFSKMSDNTKGNKEIDATDQVKNSDSEYNSNSNTGGCGEASQIKRKNNYDRLESYACGNRDSDSDGRHKHKHSYAEDLNSDRLRTYENSSKSSRNRHTSKTDRMKDSNCSNSVPVRPRYDKVKNERDLIALESESFLNKASTSRLSQYPSDTRNDADAQRETVNETLGGMITVNNINRSIQKAANTAELDGARHAVREPLLVKTGTDNDSVQKATKMIAAADGKSYFASESNASVANSRDRGLGEELRIANVLVGERKHEVFDETVNMTLSQEKICKDKIHAKMTETLLDVKDTLKELSDHFNVNKKVTNDKQSVEHHAKKMREKSGDKVEIEQIAINNVKMINQDIVSASEKTAITAEGDKHYSHKISKQTNELKAMDESILISTDEKQHSKKITSVNVKVKARHHSHKTKHSDKNRGHDCIKNSKDREANRVVTSSYTDKHSKLKMDGISSAKSSKLDENTTYDKNDKTTYNANVSKKKDKEKTTRTDNHICEKEKSNYSLEKVTKNSTVTFVKNCQASTFIELDDTQCERNQHTKSSSDKSVKELAKESKQESHIESSLKSKKVSERRGSNEYSLKSKKVSERRGSNDSSLKSKTVSERRGSNEYSMKSKTVSKRRSSSESVNSGKRSEKHSSKSVEVFKHEMHHKNKNVQESTCLEQSTKADAMDQKSTLCEKLANPSKQKHLEETDIQKPSKTYHRQSSSESTMSFKSDKSSEYKIKTDAEKKQGLVENKTEQTIGKDRDPSLKENRKSDIKHRDSSKEKHNLEIKHKDPSNRKDRSGSKHRDQTEEKHKSSKPKNQTTDKHNFSIKESYPSKEKHSTEAKHKGASEEKCKLEIKQKDSSKLQHSSDSKHSDPSKNKYNLESKYKTSSKEKHDAGIKLKDTLKEKHNVQEKVKDLYKESTISDKHRDISKEKSDSSSKHRDIPKGKHNSSSEHKYTSKEKHNSGSKKENVSKEKHNSGGKVRQPSRDGDTTTEIKQRDTSTLKEKHNTVIKIKDPSKEKIKSGSKNKRPSEEKQRESSKEKHLCGDKGIKMDSKYKESERELDSKSNIEIADTKHTYSGQCTNVKDIKFNTLEHTDINLDKVEHDSINRDKDLSKENITSHFSRKDNERENEYELCTETEKSKMKSTLKKSPLVLKSDDISITEHTNSDKSAKRGYMKYKCFELSEIDFLGDSEQMGGMVNVCKPSKKRDTRILEDEVRSKRHSITTKPKESVHINDLSFRNNTAKNSSSSQCRDKAPINETEKLTECIKGNIKQSMLSSDSSSDSDSQIFGKMDSFLNKRKKIGTNKIRKGEHSGVKKIHHSREDFIVSDEYVSFTDSSSESPEAFSESNDSHYRRKSGLKISCVKHLYNSNGKLYWKEYEIKKPVVKLKRLTPNCILKLNQQLKSEKGQRKLIKLERKRQFKRIRKLYSSNTSQSDSDFSMIARPLFVSQQGTGKKNPIENSDTDESFINELNKNSEESSASDDDLGNKIEDAGERKKSMSDDETTESNDFICLKKRQKECVRQESEETRLSESGLRETDGEDVVYTAVKITDYALEHYTNTGNKSKNLRHVVDRLQRTSRTTSDASTVSESSVNTADESGHVADTGITVKLPIINKSDSDIPELICLSERLKRTSRSSSDTSTKLSEDMNEESQSILETISKDNCVTQISTIEHHENLNLNICGHKKVQRTYSDSSTRSEASIATADLKIGLESIDTDKNNESNIQRPSSTEKDSENIKLKECENNLENKTNETEVTLEYDYTGNIEDEATQMYSSGVPVNRSNSSSFSDNSDILPIDIFMEHVADNDDHVKGRSGDYEMNSQQIFQDRVNDGNQQVVHETHPVKENTAGKYISEISELQPMDLSLKSQPLDLSVKSVKSDLPINEIEKREETMVKKTTNALTANFPKKSIISSKKRTVKETCITANILSEKQSDKEMNNNDCIRDSDKNRKNRLSLSKRRKTFRKSTTRKKYRKNSIATFIEESGIEGDIEDNDISITITSMSENENSDLDLLGEVNNEKDHSLAMESSEKTLEQVVEDRVTQDVFGKLESSTTNESVSMAMSDAECKNSETGNGSHETANLESPKTNTRPRGSADTSKSTEINRNGQYKKDNTQIEKSQFTAEQNETSLSNLCSTEATPNIRIKDGIEINPVNEEELKIKNEPEWLKFGYTQEPDVIFLSDDDEMMIMSFSHPVISLDSDSNDDMVKDVKSDLDLENPDLWDNFSSPDDGEDQGSDFEPEDIFSSVNNIKLSILESENEGSVSNVDSDVDLFKTQKESFPSRPLKTDKEDGDFDKDLTEEMLLKETASEMTVKQENIDKISDTGSRKIENTQKFDVNDNFDEFSSGDEILFTSAFAIEENLLKNSQNYRKNTTDPNLNLNHQTQTLSVTPAISEDKKIQKILPYTEITPNLQKDKNIYLQDTQTDFDNDDDFDKEISVFDFHSEHFSDISDSEASQSSAVTKMQPKARGTVEKLIEKEVGASYETISEDDGEIARDPRDMYKLETQINMFDKITKEKASFSGTTKEKNNLGVSLTYLDGSNVYQAETQVDTKSEYNDQFCEISDEEADEDDHDDYADPQLQAYFMQTQGYTSVDRRRYLDQIGLKYDDQSFVDSDNVPSYETETQADSLTQKYSKDIYEFNTELSDDSQNQVNKLNAIKNRKGKGESKWQSHKSNDIYDVMAQKVDKIKTEVDTDRSTANDKVYQEMTQIETVEQPVDDEYDKYFAMTQKDVHSSDKQNTSDGVTDRYFAMTQVESNKNNSHLYPADVYDFNTDSSDDDQNQKNIFRKIKDNMNKGGPVLKPIKQGTDGEIVKKSLDKNDGIYDVLTRVVDKRKTEVGSKQRPDNDKVYLEMTQVHGSKHTEDVKYDKYFAMTQKDVHVSDASDEVTDGYFAMTQVESNMNNDGHIGDEEDPYLAMTQVERQDVDFMDSNDDHDAYNDMTQVDIDSYIAASKVDDETIRKSNKKVDKRYLAMTQVDNIDSESETDKVKLPPPCNETFIDAAKTKTKTIEKANIFKYSDGKSGIKRMDLPKGNTQSKVITDHVGILKRPADMRGESKAVYFQEQNVKKPRLDIPAKKAIVIEPQKMKSTAEKRESVKSSIPSTPSKIAITEQKSTVKQFTVLPRLVLQAEKDKDLVIVDANKSDMWLSKQSTKNKKKKTESSKGKNEKRKRRRSKEDPSEELKWRMAGARSRLAERNMQSIVNPNIIADPATKRMKPAPVNSVETEDVDLPSDSQVIRKGLPLLNPMGLFSKKKKPLSSQSENVTKSTKMSKDNEVRINSATKIMCTVTIATATTSISVLSTNMSKTVATVHTNKENQSSRSYDTLPKVNRKEQIGKGQNSGQSDKTKTVRWNLDPVELNINNSTFFPSTSSIRNSSTTKDGSSTSVHASVSSKSPQNKDSLSSAYVQSSSKPGSSPCTSAAGLTTGSDISPVIPKTLPCRNGPSTSSGSSSSNYRSYPNNASYYRTSAYLAAPSTSSGHSSSTSRTFPYVGGPSTSTSTSSTPATRYATFQKSVQGTNLMQKIPLTSTASSDRPPDGMVNKNKELQWDHCLRVILKWSPNWFEEREKLTGSSSRYAEPPPVTNDLGGHDRHQLFPLVERYNSFDEYSDNFMLPLLLHETWESCYSTWREKKSRGQIKQRKFIFSQQAPAGEKLLLYTLQGLISENERRQGRFVNEGELIQLNVFGDLRFKEKSEERWYQIMGFVERVVFCETSVSRICAHNEEISRLRKQDSISIKMLVRIRLRSFFPKDNVLVCIQEIGSLIILRRQFQGLAYLPKSPLCRDLLFPTNSPTYCDKAAAIITGLRGEYNESQSLAINTAAKIASLPKILPRICLLQGPPGTGKSHTIVGIITKIVQDTRGKCRICLCAPSNAAVDELLRRLHRQNNKNKQDTVKLVRLGKKSSIHPDVQSICLESLVQKNILKAHKEDMLRQLPQSLQGERKTLANKIKETKENIKTATEPFQSLKWKTDLIKLERQQSVLDRKCTVDMNKIPKDVRKEKQLRMDLLQKANVVAGTLSSMGNQYMKTFFQPNIINQQVVFDCVIIDEATQAIELDTLIPLQYGTTKLILVGDPEQLPPTVLSRTAQENKFNMSLFQRLDSHFKFSKNINPVIFLDTQYRMDKEIAMFPNKYIYDGRLQNHQSVIDRQFPLVPYLLYDITEGKEQFSPTTKSISNMAEAKFTAELCKLIVAKTKVMEMMIGIIAPYTKQKELIVGQLQQRGLKNIEVSTVDGFQGREKDVIVMSCVRANASGAVSFIGNRNRMNVSLTRAKHAMYLVGRFDSLQSSDEWKPLISDAGKRKKIVSVQERYTEQAVRQCLKRNSW